jgi:hypothetical protein
MGEKMMLSEALREKALTFEEVDAERRIDKFVGSKERVPGKHRVIHDEHGLRLHEVTVKVDGVPGIAEIEYSYQRKAAHEGVGSRGSATESMINVMFYDEDGVPGGGHTLAELRDGKWVSTGLSSSRPELPKK